MITHPKPYIAIGKKNTRYPRASRPHRQLCCCTERHQAVRDSTQTPTSNQVKKNVCVYMSDGAVSDVCLPVLL
jgi:hypothetical protein